MVLALIFGCVASASAAPTADTEPNDNIFQANGPVSTEGVTGSLASSDDADYFKLRLRPQRQVRFNYFSNNCGWLVDFEIRDLGGTTIASEDTNSSSTDTLTTPGVFGGATVDTWLIVDGAGPGCTYQFTVTNTTGGPTDAIDPGAGPTLPIVPTSEPNDMATQAFGPLTANVVYSGKFETSNDEDWLYVPLRSGFNVTYSLSAAGGSADATMRSSDGRTSLSYVSVSNGSTDSRSTMTAGSTVHYFSIEGQTDAEWRLQIGPAEAIGAPVASARIAKRKLRRGKSIRVLVSNSSSTSLRFKLKRGTKTVRSGRRSIVGGLATISTRKLRRGNYRLEYTIPGIGTRSARIRLT